MISNIDAFVDSLQSIDRFLRRLDIYTQIPPTPAVDELVVEIMVEIISMLFLVTKEFEKRRSSESLLADVLVYSELRSQIWKEIFQ